MEQDNDEKLKPTFRIRFTISNNDNQCNNQEQTNERDHSQCQTVDEGVASRSSSSTSGYSSIPETKKRSFRFIQPQQHKSSLFVNLSDKSDRAKNHLFISPDLNQFTPASPPSPNDSTICSLKRQPENPFSLLQASDHPPKMSQGCNFINSWMTASRRRSASVTPQAPAAKNPSDEVIPNGRRASSSDDLVVPESPLNNRSPSNNHLAVGVSNETICDKDSTQVNERHLNINFNNDRYIQQADLGNMGPLHVEINSPDDFEDQYMNNGCGGGGEDEEDDEEYINLDELSENELEEECRKLEMEVESWEKKVDELERKRISDDVPRTLVEKVLNQRRKMRDLETQIYMLNLESEESDRRSFSHRSFVSPAGGGDENMIVDFGSPHSKLMASRFGSRLKPGQENTADILEVVPPSGSLQYRQYLNKASSGTDSSEYSHLPTYDPQHRHHLPQTQVSSDDSSSNMSTNNNRRHRSYHLRNRHRGSSDQRSGKNENAKLPSIRQACSPVRPNHFKGEFRELNKIPSQESSSTGSSSSPH